MSDLTSPTQRDIYSLNLTTDEQRRIVNRIQAGQRFMEPFVARWERCANRYLDPSTTGLRSRWMSDQKPRSTPVGEYNLIATNIRIKAAAYVITEPDFQIEAEIPEAGKIIRLFLKRWWRNVNATRIFRRVFVSRAVGGMGFVAYSWDRQRGAILDYLRPADVAVDPHVTDETWNNLRWGAKRICLPYDVAKARYGEEKLVDPENVFIGDQNEYNEQEKKVDIWVYYDEEIEAEIHGSRLLRATPNLYRSVPIRVFQGDVNPDGEFGLSDYDVALGVYEMFRRQQKILNNVAEHGIGVPWLRSEFVDERIVERLLSGEHQGPILVQGAPGEQVVGYTANQNLSEANITALRLLQEAIDSEQGVTDLDRGTPATPSETATKTALRSQRSATRANQNRIELETFVEGIMYDVIRLYINFGLDPLQDPTEQDIAIWEALSTVQEIRIVEESMMHKDPALKQQQAMQLFSLALQAFPVMTQLGITPNLKRLFDDILRSFDRRDVDSYYLMHAGLASNPDLAMMGQQAAPEEGITENGEIAI